MSRTSRLLAILDAHLRTPALTSLVLLPLLPAPSTNLIFELVPAYRSCKALLARPNSAKRHAQLAQLQQWLAYWLIYAVVRLLELTRFRLDSLREMQHITRILPRFLYNLLRLPSTTSARASAPSPPVRTQTLATQLAGTPLRWTMFKCILLFYAMDEKLQGARWLLEKVVKPIAGFFTGLEEGIEEAARTSKRSIARGVERAEEAIEGSTADLQEEHILSRKRGSGTPDLTRDSDSTMSTGGSVDTPVVQPEEQLYTQYWSKLPSTTWTEQSEERHAW